MVKLDITYGDYTKEMIKKSYGTTSSERLSYNYNVLNSSEEKVSEREIRELFNSIIEKSDI